ncbi:tRNA pseudouridine(38-40) synthase [Fonsecaea erecta]|uniref:tRNA pseudouridine(38-40) synthase n=1 Tax=Fonsecaea erecta TaxID=1367422 RepID=A0A178ZHW2_9EURO|nr:tRNA pseudouridine(38-40) synthase [Fonsecaea erecta]OAP59232.1 tRNA pseudouridine(38-40) synthase [Fonsecaea erecta]
MSSPSTQKDQEATSTAETVASDTMAADYTSFSTDELVGRITTLERQLREQTALLASLTQANQATRTSFVQGPPEPSQTIPTARSRSPSSSRPRSPRRARPFNPALYSTRHIALKFAYLGRRYGGYEHANNNLTPQPTIEEVLWKALRKARLISPVLAKGVDESYDVVWGEDKRRETYLTRWTREAPGQGQGNGESGGKRVRLDLNWEGCQYSKCGRTDKGVSAFGQVIGIRVRSNRALETGQESTPEESGRHGAVKHQNGDGDGDGAGDTTMPSIDAADLVTDNHTKPFDPIKDELPYISLLNSILPPDIRILAWCPCPPPMFDARFSCRERRYKYFFTNPAFCPTPGPLGLQRADGKGLAGLREGWLDIEKMREAARKLVGAHDFRNLCKIDASKQMPSCVRRVTFADVVEFPETGRMFLEHEGLNQTGSASSVLGKGMAPGVSGGPKVYTFCVHGSAFLWHQVRCMVAVLFLVGQGLEEPSIIDDLLDIEKNPRRPAYEMADDAPLVLWDCIFPDNENADGGMMEDSLPWLYAGDAATVPALTTTSTKNDGKFGTGSVVDELWTLWRDAKMQELLAGSLLDLAISQGDGTPLRRQTTRDGLRGRGGRSQKVFDGGSRARTSGRYVPVMKKPRIETLEVLNAKWAKRGEARNKAKEEFEETNAEVE